MKQAQLRETVSQKFGINVDNLESYIKPITHENNPVTKKEIFEHLTKRQIEQINFYHEKHGLDWQDLDPRLNRFNSVRYQYLKNSGHYLGEEIKKWKCYVEGCQHFQTRVIAYFVSFGDHERTVCDYKVHPDDILQIGQKGTNSGHLSESHPDTFNKRLGKLTGQTQ